MSLILVTSVFSGVVMWVSSLLTIPNDSFLWSGILVGSQKVNSQYNKLWELPKSGKSGIAICSCMGVASLMLIPKESFLRAVSGRAVCADSDTEIWAVSNWVVFHLCRYACKYARYLLSVALSFGRWVIVPPRRKSAAEQRNILMVSPDLNC